jgi:hypothetical protein
LAPLAVLALSADNEFVRVIAALETEAAPMSARGINRKFFILRMVYF